LREVLTDFWFNHFNVSFFKGECAQFIPAYEREVIRPNALGKFDQLLLASAKSPAVDLWSLPVMQQKIDYIHNNPLQDKWQLVQYPEDYKYSSARFYETGVDEFDLLTHHMGE